MSAAIQIVTEGRRHYLRGDTYQMRDQLRAAGAKWDPDQRCWWTGKRDVAERLAGASSESPAASDHLDRDSKVAGKAAYKGRQYLLVWEGETKRGRACKLAFSDGSKVFWADASEVTVTKRYDSRRDRWGRSDGMTFGRLQRLREEFRASGGDAEAANEARAERSGRCRGCGGPLQDCAHHAAMGGYCGQCAFDEYDC